MQCFLAYINIKVIPWPVWMPLLQNCNYNISLSNHIWKWPSRAQLFPAWSCRNSQTIFTLLVLLEYLHTCLSFINNSGSGMGHMYHLHHSVWSVWAVEQSSARAAPGALWKYLSVAQQADASEDWQDISSPPRGKGNKTTVLFRRQ